MSVHKIPVHKLSPEALQGVIEEFITRAGTDYGEIEAVWTLEEIDALAS